MILNYFNVITLHIFNVIKFAPKKILLWKFSFPKLWMLKKSSKLSLLQTMLEMMEINCRCFKLKFLDKHVISRGQSKLLIQQNV